MQRNVEAGDKNQMWLPHNVYRSGVPQAASKRLGRGNARAPYYQSMLRGETAMTIKRWGSPTHTARASDIPDWVSYDENVTPKRTKILTPLSVMVSLGLDFNDPSQRFEMPTQCGMSHLRPATLPLRGRNACAEPVQSNSCCED